MRIPTPRSLVESDPRVLPPLVSSFASRHGRGGPGRVPGPVRFASLHHPRKTHLQRVDYDTYRPDRLADKTFTSRGRRVSSAPRRTAFSVPFSRVSFAGPGAVRGDHRRLLYRREPPPFVTSRLSSLVLMCVPFCPSQVLYFCRLFPKRTLWVSQDESERVLS